MPHVGGQRDVLVRESPTDDEIHARRRQFRREVGELLLQRPVELGADGDPNQGSALLIGRVGKQG